MRKITLLIILSITGSLFAKKEPCDYVHTKDDPFGTSVRSSYIYPSMGAQTVAIKEENNKRVIVLKHCVRSDLFVVLPGGTKAFIALDDGNIITLTSPSDAAPERKLNTYGPVSTHWLVEYDASDEVLLQLSKSPIKAIKTTIAQKDIVMDYFTKKEIKVIQNAAQCFSK